MANWALPTLSSLYTDFLAELSGRLDDSATMFSGGPTNQPTGSIRYFRSTNVLQEWNGTAWVDKVISIAGGGTGATTPSGIVASLNLGTMSAQNANAVNITGGSLTGITGLSVVGNIAVSGSISFTTDNASVIGTNTARPSTLYLRSGLVIPVGTDKFVTS